MKSVNHKRTILTYPIASGKITTQWRLSIRLPSGPNIEQVISIVAPTSNGR